MVAGSIPWVTQTASMAIYDAVQAGDDTTTAGLLVLATSALTITILLTANRLKPHL